MCFWAFLFPASPVCVFLFNAISQKCLEVNSLHLGTGFDSEPILCLWSEASVTLTKHIFWPLLNNSWADSDEISRKNGKRTEHGRSSVQRLKLPAPPWHHDTLQNRRVRAQRSAIAVFSDSLLFTSSTQLKYVDRWRKFLRHTLPNFKRRPSQNDRFGHWGLIR